MFKRSAVNMTEGPITTRLLLFSIPIMLSGVLQLLYNAADVVVVGKFAGHTSLAAVGSTSSLVTLITNLALGLSVGVNIIIARHIGAKDSERSHKALHTAATVAIFAGFLTAVVGFFISRTALELMGSPDDVIDKSTLYLKIYFLGAPASVIYNFGSAALRSAGDTTRPLYFLTASGLVNVILNLVFVIVFHMDVAGVALATIISQYISAFLVVMALKKGQGMLLLRFSSVCFDKKEFAEIIRLGIPAAIQGATFSISNVIIQSGVNSFDDSLIVAGNSAASNIEGFIYTVMNAFYHSTMTFTSQNIGAKKPERIPKIILRASVLCAISWAIITAVVLGFSEELLGLYTDEAGAVAIGVERLNLVAATYILCGIMEISTAVLRGSGYSIVSMIISIIGVCGIRIFWVLAVFPTFHEFKTLFMCYPLSWTPVIITNFIAFAIIYKKKLLPSVQKLDK
jgi:putative MATE family efflux protein